MRSLVRAGPHGACSSTALAPHHQWRQVPEIGRMVGSTTHRGLLPHTLAIVCSCPPCRPARVPFSRGTACRSMAHRDTVPCDEASRIPPQAMQIALRRRLRLPYLFAPAAAAPTQDVVAPWTLAATMPSLARGPACWPNVPKSSSALGSAWHVRPSERRSGRAAAVARPHGPHDRDRHPSRRPSTSLGPGSGVAGHARPKAVLATASWTATERAPQRLAQPEVAAACWRPAEGSEPEVANETLRSSAPAASDPGAQDQKLLRAAPCEFGGKVQRLRRSPRRAWGPASPLRGSREASQGARSSRTSEVISCGTFSQAEKSLAKIIELAFFFELRRILILIHRKNKVRRRNCMKSSRMCGAASP